MVVIKIYITSGLVCYRAALLCGRNWRVFSSFLPSENVILSKDLFWVLQLSKEGKPSSFCSFCTCFYRAICEVAAVRWLLVEMRPGILHHLFNWLGSGCTRAACTANSHCCTLHPTRVTGVSGFGRKSFLEQRSFTELVFCVIEELLRIPPHHLLCGSLPACNPSSIALCLVHLGCPTGTFMWWHFSVLMLAVRWRCHSTSYLWQIAVNCRNTCIL